MTSPVSGPLHQAIDTLLGPAAKLSRRLTESAARITSWTDLDGESTGVDAVAAQTAAWWHPHPADEVEIDFLDGIASSEVALVETLYLHGSAVGLGHSAIAFAHGQESRWRQYGDPTAARREIEIPDFPRPSADPTDHLRAERQRSIVLDFFARHDKIGGVVEAWDAYAAPDVLLWHSAEGVRGRGRAAVLDFYRAQHQRYPYSQVSWDLQLIESRPGYTAGEITYTLRHESQPTIVLPASFAVDFDDEDRILAWRDYSRSWLPA